MLHKFTFIENKHLNIQKFRQKKDANKFRLTASTTGAMSTFGGPGDSGVSASEGLALLTNRDLTDPAFSYLFELEQPVGTTGLARRLDSKQFFIAMRWDYSKTSKAWLRLNTVTVTANGITVKAKPVDWGPAEWTNRIADIAKGLALRLKLKTNDIVTVSVG